MAIYHFSAQVIGRKSGRSSVAAAAYRSGEKMEDERLGLNYDYTKKSGVSYTEIITPENTPEWAKNREQLWNKVEAIEKRSDAQLAREINIALPNELNREQQIELTRNFVKENFTNNGMIADIAIHNNENNPHAHIMLTTREISNDGFGRKNREWNNKDLLVQWRESWSQHINKALEKINCKERVDHRTLKAQGIDREPQIHVGSHANAIEKKKGIETDRGNINREINETNKKLQEIKNEKVVLMNEYKSAKEDQQRINNFFKQFNQEEREILLKAQSVLGRYASIDNIDKYNKYLDKNISFWNDLDNKLTNKMKNLEDANNILENLKQAREQYKNAALFSQDRKNLKDSINKLEGEFKNKIDFIERYKHYGIKNEKSFETKYSDLKSQEIQKRIKYENSRQIICAKKGILHDAEAILKEAECRKFARYYKEFEEYKNILNPESVKSINDLNRAAGTKLTFDEIENLGDKVYKINQDKDRLARAERYLNENQRLKELSEKHESKLGQVKRVFSSKLEEQYRDIQQKIELTKEKYENCRVDSVKDLMQQKEKLNRDINSLPQWYKELAIKAKEKELNSRLYQLYRQEKKYEEANKSYDILKQQRDNLNNTSLLSGERLKIKEQIQLSEERFNRLRVGDEKEFKKNYAAIRDEIQLKRNSIEDQKKQLEKIVDISLVSDISIKAKNTTIELHNMRFINDYYKNNTTERVVNGNEYRGSRDNEGSSRRNPEADGRFRTIFTSGNRQFEGTPNQRSGYSQNLQRANNEGQREDSRNLQQNSGSSKHISKDNRGKVLEGTTGGTKESPGKHQEQQDRNNFGIETNDRKVPSQNRASIFSKNSNSIFNSRFKPTMSNNIQSSARLDERLRAQIEENKLEMEGDNKKDIVKENVKSKSNDRER